MIFIKLKNDIVFCICLNFIRFQTFENFLHFIFYRNFYTYNFDFLFVKIFNKFSSRISSIRNIKSILQTKHAKVWKIDENTYSNRICVCLNISKFFYIETISFYRFVICSKFKQQIDFTNEINMQKFKKMSKIHIQMKHALIWIFRNFFISKRFCNIKSILQQLNEIDNHAKVWNNVENTQSIQTYICLNVSQFFCK